MKDPADYREIYRRHLREKYLKTGPDKCFHHCKHIDTRLLLVKEYGISEKTSCGVPQQDCFMEMEHMFDPDEPGCNSSKTVVLQGCPGSGKTAMVHKFMFDWAAGMVTPGRFDYLIYVNCREIGHNGPLSAIDLIGNTFQDIKEPILDIIIEYPEKLLFILDGFPELPYIFCDHEEDLSDNPQEKKPVESLLCSFVKKTLFPESSLLITARLTAMKKLHSLLKQPIEAEILWFRDAEKRAYFLSQISGANRAMSVFYDLRDNEHLDIISSLPIVSWMLCRVLQSQDDEDKNLMKSLNTMTGVYLFYFAKCLRTLKGISVWMGQSCLRGLCSLAAEGLQNRQVLFAVSDLQRHGVGIHETTCDFLNHFLKKVEGDVNMYTFLHFSFQEFLTAVYYVLKNDNSCAAFNQAGKTWQEIFHQFGKGFSSPTIQFLFGLIHKGKEEVVKNVFGRQVSQELEEALLKWTEIEIKDKTSRLQMEPVDLFHCLYELQDTEYAGKIVDHLQSLVLLQATYTKMDTLAMSFCVKNCHSDLSMSLKCQHLLGFEEEIHMSVFMPSSMPTASNVSFNHSFQLHNLYSSQLHFLCQALRDPACKIKDLKLIFCHLTDACGRDLSSVFDTNQCLTELEFVKNTLDDSGMKHFCHGLTHSHCTLQTLRLYRCLISSDSCGVLAAVLTTNRCLTELEFNETKLEASALQMLCEGLKHPNCKVQKLKLCGSLLPESSEIVCKYLASVFIYNQHITELDLSENPLGDQGVKYLCAGLRNYNCKVEKLELSECSLSAACCETLAQVLCFTHSLTKLLLINNKIGDLGLKLLCEGLKQPDCQLKDLALWTCHLTGACCQDLCNALYTNEHLTDLDLSDNALGDEGIKVLCKGLEHPSCKLQTLWIAECHLTDECSGALASVLNRNERLLLLDLSGNNFKDFGIQMMCDSLIHSRSNLKTFYIDTDNLCEATMSKMEILKISKPGITW
ncbi:NACHT, LRR and PYD domains-containing protein 12-like isoform 1-T1 [Thomomys bottae]